MVLGDSTIRTSRAPSLAPAPTALRQLHRFVRPRRGPTAMSSNAEPAAPDRTRDSRHPDSTRGPVGRGPARRSSVRPGMAATPRRTQTPCAAKRRTGHVGPRQHRLSAPSSAGPDGSLRWRHQSVRSCCQNGPRGPGPLASNQATSVQPGWGGAAATSALKESRAASTPGSASASFFRSSKGPNTGDKLRSGARVRTCRRGHEAACPSRQPCRRELRQLHPLVRLRPSFPVYSASE
jgi:hypothetical protein